MEGKPDTELMSHLADVDEFGVSFDAENPLALDDETFDSDAAGSPYHPQKAAQHATRPPGTCVNSCSRYSTLCFFWVCWEPVLMNGIPLVRWSELV
jgi:hypothetical protein